MLNSAKKFITKKIPKRKPISECRFNRRGGFYTRPPEPARVNRVEGGDEHLTQEQVCDLVPA